MGTIKRFEEIEVWSISRILTKKVWDISNTGTFRRDFALKDQINRSSGSIMDNIAEGFGRGGNREFINFLSYARGSNDEVRSQIHRAFDRSHIDGEQFEHLMAMSISIGLKINNLMVYLKRSKYTGQKFKNR